MTAHSATGRRETLTLERGRPPKSEADCQRNGVQPVLQRYDFIRANGSCRGSGCLFARPTTEVLQLDWAASYARTPGSAWRTLPLRHDAAFKLQSSSLLFSSPFPHPSNCYRIPSRQAAKFCHSRCLATLLQTSRTLSARLLAPRVL